MQQPKVNINSGVMSVRYAKKPTAHVIQRLKEFGFVSKNYRTFLLSRPINENQYDYLQGLFGFVGLGMAYFPATEKGFVLDTITPDSMGYEMHIAVRKVKIAVGGSLFNYVCEKLDYTADELTKSLSAEQCDAVALAIFNIEVKKQGIIVGDQTGIGKGRVAAALIRYGVVSGKQPIFLSEKPNLFTDLYRDLVDIGSEHFVPFIVNGKESKTHIKDKNGNIVYSAPEKKAQEKIIDKQKLPKDYNFVCATYSQFNQPMKKPAKPMFLSAMAQDNILIMDEAHNASGSSATGEFMQSVLVSTKGVCFLSATFAKRPDNMPIYAMKTAMGEASMSKIELVEAIEKGGVALQEVLASQLVAEGQMIRRERSFEGVEVNYLELTSKAKEQARIADKVTSIIRNIIYFQGKYVKPAVEEMDEIAAAEGKSAELRKGTSKAGVDNSPYFSKIFNVINQLLFSINAPDVAEHAIKRLREGKKPVIAFASTMGSFLSDMGSNGDVINADFTTVLQKGLDGVLQITTKDINGKSQKSDIPISELDPDGQKMYADITRQIEATSSGITISPIDLIVQRIEEAGFTTGEVTGRSICVEYKNLDSKGETKAVIKPRKKENTADLFRQFNDNEVDCLLINQSGSTGASAHAIVTDVVPAEQVKQRVMVILQPELNISTEIQKRGRINRTGQIMKPIYDYIISAIPAQNRFMMMLKKKLKSLDANTTSNQKNSNSQLESEDFLNKYGDKVVELYLEENPDLDIELGSPLESSRGASGAASKVTGRVAILPVKDQEKFYADVIERYKDYVTYLRQTGDYDIEVETLDLQSEVLDEKVVIAGSGGESAFSENTYLQRCECNVLKKPFTRTQLDEEIAKSLDGSDMNTIAHRVRDAHNLFVAKKLEDDLLSIEEHYDTLTKNVPNEKKYKKLDTEYKREEYIRKRVGELDQARNGAIDKAVKSSSNKKTYLNSFFSYFAVGYGYYFPSQSIEDGAGDNTLAIFLGFDIDTKKKNPYAPSAVKLRFAVADSRKYIALACSGDTGAEIERIKGRSMDMHINQKKDAIERWAKEIEAFSSNRKVRWIVTGNILQGSADFKGKLVDYTLKGGGEAKGILMPDAWSPDARENNANARVSVPILKALPYMQSLGRGKQVYTDNKVSITKTWSDDYDVMMPKSKKAYGYLYTDMDLIECLDNTADGFWMSGGYMRGKVLAENFERFIKVLGGKHSLALNIPRSIFDAMFGDEMDRPKEKDPLVKKAEQMLEKDKKAFEKRLDNQNSGGDKARKLKLMKVKAKALKLKLKLINI